MQKRNYKKTGGKKKPNKKQIQAELLMYHENQKIKQASPNPIIYKQFNPFEK